MIIQGYQLLAMNASELLDSPIKIRDQLKRDFVFVLWLGKYNTPKQEEDFIGNGASSLDRQYDYGKEICQVVI